MRSPYEDVPLEEWKTITEKLVDRSPLSIDEIRALTLESWQELWQTKIGVGETAIPLAQIEVPATVVGYFFEKLFVRNLQQKQPNKWRGPREKGDKDIVYLADDSFSIEMKTSGQLGTKIFGNRSYGQLSADPTRAQKKKSGYYITVNFYGMTLNLIRFGWVDHSDWKPQKSPTGQMAGLPDEVYRYKLIPIHGDYQLKSPIYLLEGVGAKLAESLALQGIISIEDILRSESHDRKILALQRLARTFLGE